MKKVLIALTLVVAISCKENESKADSKNTISATTTATNEPLDSAAIAKIGAHLRTLDPVDTSILSSIFPTAVLNIQKTNTKGSEEVIPLNELDAEYQGENKTVNIHIIDGGSKQTDAYMTIEYYLNEIHLSKLDNKSYEMEKNEIINNFKTYSNQTNADGDISSTIAFVVNNRFGIQISGTNISLEELKPIVSTLNLSKLQ